jgi:hypothetical protein
LGPFDALFECDLLCVVELVLTGFGLAEEFESTIILLIAEVI